MHVILDNLGENECFFSRKIRARHLLVDVEAAACVNHAVIIIIIIIIIRNVLL
jgi:hypothetical protein